MLKFLNDVFACAVALIVWLIQNGWVNCSVKAKVQRLCSHDVAGGCRL